MVRAIILIVVFLALLFGCVLSAEFKALMGIAGIFGTTWAIGWLIEPRDRA